MNKKKQVVNKKHRKTRTRTKNLNDLSLKLRKKKTPIIKKEDSEEIVSQVKEEKVLNTPKPEKKKSATKKTVVKKTVAKKSTAKKKK